MIPARAWPDDLEPGSTLHRTERDGVIYGCILSPAHPRTFYLAGAQPPYYRYALWAIWDDFLPKLFLGLLNPSKATHEHDDPTWQRGRERARRLGYGGVLMMNAGAIRETDRAKACAHPDPIGKDNETWLRTLIPFCDLHILGFGPDAAKFGGDQLMRRVFQEIGLPTYALKINADGSPSHPLYLAYDLQPIPLWGLGDG